MPIRSPMPSQAVPTSGEPSSSDGILACGTWYPFPSRTLIMGVLNVTPDSFSDGGRFVEPSVALDHALRMVDEGADVIDIGGESSRPGADAVSEDEEIRRVIPVVRALAPRVRVPVSVDTTKAEVARQALDHGAVVINDISALRADEGMRKVVAQRGAGIILMHMQGTPKSMQVAPQYGDVVSEVTAFLQARMDEARVAGIAEKQMLLDPGVGFGKTLAQNLMLLEGLGSLTVLGRPLVVGVSRKAFIGHILDRSVLERAWGTAAAVTLAVQRGARMVRVHDVGAMRDVLRVADAILRVRQPAVSSFSEEPDAGGKG